MEPMSPTTAMNFARSEDESSELMVHFYSRPVKVEGKSEKAGRPIYEERDYVEIRVPGQPRDVIDRPVKEEDKTRFAAKWRQYQENKSQAPEGTPIFEWQGISRSRAMELQALNIPTVEALAQVSDANLDKIGAGARELRGKAQAFIDSESIEDVRAERDRLQAEVDRLTKEVEDLTKPASGTTAKKRKPGRPKKNVAS